MESTNPQPVTGGIAQAARWTGVSKALGQLATFGTTLVVARWILREDFGLFALALAYVALIDIVVDLGFVAALIQRPKISQDELSSCFWLLCGTSAVLFVIGEVAAPVALAAAFSDDRLVLVIRTVSIAFLVVPVTVLCSGLLARNLRLETLAKIEIASALSRCTVTLALAYRGYGVMSLVIGFLADRILLSGMAFAVTGWRPSLVWRRNQIREIVAFGAQVFLSRILWYFYSKLDTLIIGRLLGLEVLGLYSMAGQIAGAFFQFVSSAYYRLAYPVFAQLQGSPELGRQVLKFSNYLAIVALPVFLGISATAHDIVGALLDQRWAGVAVPLQVLAAVGVVQTLSGLLPQATNAMGKPGLNTMVNLVSVPVFAAGFYLGALYFGMKGVLVAWVILVPLRFALIILLSCPLLQIPVAQYVRASAGPVISALVMVVVVYGLGLAMHGWAQLPRLGILVVVGAAIYVVASLFLYRDAFVALVRMMLPKAPQVAR
ncbi:MAG: lipopolysaccharide biosynthesis protein [Gammaproteobacteria bacterium PRO9]|nr:lipopolysaccharide biosynthesis protein [Gammaproteobacteria bacterium PRO9]